MSQHTKGKWEFTGETDWNGDYVITVGGNGDGMESIIVCQVNGELSSDYSPQANARLIANAPEMYDLLGDILSMFTEYDEWGVVDDTEKELYEKLQALTDRIDKGE